MANVLSELSNDLADVVDAAAPGVARVAARRRHAASGVVWSADGVIVTAHHVVERENDILVTLDGGDDIGAELVGRDPSTDVAVLKADASDLRQAAWADEASARVGHLVLALGRPGSSAAATLGVVSAVGGPWRTPAGGSLQRYLQTDVVMYPGFSGGPLVDSAGGVLGINTSALVRGVALTVTRASLEGIVETLLSHGRIRRGFLGIGTQPVTLPDRFRELAGQDSGLLVSSVQPDGPADKAGFLLGDTLVEVDGKSVSVPEDLMTLLSGDLIGRSTSARVVRGGELVQLNVTVGERS